MNSLPLFCGESAAFDRAAIALSPKILRTIEALDVQACCQLGATILASSNERLASAVEMQRLTV
ncbi:hypothetical protein [Sphaerothrix gracilis]|uniref:hypothetical protein n=1 Tax=Sphaerothrix gracilis TaxID=3151835 RepID=UPI0031FD8285